MKISPLAVLILICVLARMCIAALIEFGNDEVYYFTYALHLQSNYFDHPPGIAFLIRLSTLNLLFQNEFFVRLGPIICSCIGTYLSFKIGNLIRNERTGYYAALLYNTSIYSSIICGVFILPDSPQVVFWLCGIGLAIKIIILSQQKIPIPLLLWLLFGLTCGFCMMCKVHGIFLWFGLGIYILLFDRKLLGKPLLYLSAIISILVFSPVIIWNINNQFVTWNFHSNRINESVSLINLTTFIRAFLGQLFYNNPINVVLTGVALFHLRKSAFLNKNISRILMCLGLPIIIATVYISLFNNVLPHWSGPGFLTLSFIAAAYLDKIVITSPKRASLILKSSSILIITVMIAGISIINFYPGTLGKTKEKEFGKSDFTLDMWGWREFGKQYAVFVTQQKKLKTDIPEKIVCNKWFPAAHIDYYVARPLQNEVIGLGSLINLHHYVWLNQYKSGLKKGENAICMMPGNYPEDVCEVYKKYFSSIKLLKVFPLYRGGKRTKIIWVYLLSDYNGKKD
ncbi:hypothetical protein ADIARSV_3413 [Arcticibacter svalbardensis MN12-7]|uniref:Glycosyltransferase RgtA/B/C/D-like domain-containing protein n=1 Tax=Arcticibacter svalbardensis MN12-7 TaxID=1150600 RepID=R9GWK9_9SPHI|nr:glycosyltransferase family 39 protein [Arcticibacter svalbardensis]EOR93334.1 hypothetical protein ADIARSV_3413 [Arcticibacter svalbardensis MN12-7]